MSKKEPSWIEKFTDTSTRLEVEAFTPTASETATGVSYTAIAANNALIAGQMRTTERVAFALRIKKSINDKLQAQNLACSKNDAINILIEFALDELEKQKRSLIIK